jgi:hypothetical protein
LENTFPKSPRPQCIDLNGTRCYDLFVRLELPITQHLRSLLRHSVLVSLFGLCGVLFVHAQTQKPSLPDPVKFVNKFDIVANVVHAVLEDMGFKIETEDRKGGKITTRPYEFITGSLTSSEVDKVAAKNDTATGSWTKAQYSIEALLEIVSPTETMVTVRTKMEALNRDIDGTEKWIALDSLGSVERRILGRISTKLMMDTDAPQNDGKGFWKKRPQPVDPRQPRFPSSTPR